MSSFNSIDMNDKVKRQSEKRKQKCTLPNAIHDGVQMGFSKKLYKKQDERLFSTDIK